MSVLADYVTQFGGGGVYGLLIMDFLVFSLGLANPICNYKLNILHCEGSFGKSRARI